MKLLITIEGPPGVLKEDLGYAIANMIQATKDLHTPMAVQSAYVVLLYGTDFPTIEKVKQEVAKYPTAEVAILLKGNFE